MIKRVEKAGDVNVHLEGGASAQCEQTLGEPLDMAGGASCAWC